MTAHDDAIELIKHNITHIWHFINLSQQDEEALISVLETTKSVIGETEEHANDLIDRVIAALQGRPE